MSCRLDNMHDGLHTAEVLITPCDQDRIPSSDRDYAFRPLEHRERFPSRS